MKNIHSIYQVKNIDLIDSPALLVYPDLARENIQKTIEIAGNPERLRPHVKTHKMTEIARMHLEMGISKFKCATISEAEMLGIEGAEDVLLAYQPIGPKILRLINLIKKFPKTKFSAIVDDEEIAQDISDAAASHDVQIDLLLDLNFGMSRTGIATDGSSEKLYQLIQDLPNVNPGGLHAYDGHIRDTDFALRKERSDAGFEAVEALKSRLEDIGLPVPQVIAGGSPTFGVHALRDDVFLSPGTYIFWDAGYGSIVPEYPFTPAALVMMRVLSKPEKDLLCLDLGHKAIASENPHPRVKILGLEVEEFTGHSEEHLVLRSPQAKDFKVGDVLYGIPRHICPTVALHQEAVIIRNNEAVEQWRVVARDRRLTV